MKLYDYAPSCNCYKVRLLLAQLELPCERIPTDIFDGATLTEEFGRMNPLRTTPVLETDEGELLAESAAILWYLAEGTRFLPEDRLERSRVLGWLAYEQADLIPPIGGLRFRLQTGRLAAGDPGADARRAAGVEVLEFLETSLEGRTFLVADAYSIADIAVYGYLHVAHEAGYAIEEYPNVAAWLERVASQPNHIDDVEPYPANARPGAGRSTYE
jgi:glutathione S-transferase